MAGFFSDFPVGASSLAALLSGCARSAGVDAVDDFLVDFRDAVVVFAAVFLVFLGAFAFSDSSVS